MQYIRIGNVKVSRFIVGGNPFSGFSHQSVEMDEQMRHYYSCQRIKDTFAEAESLGVNTFLGRSDFHIVRLLAEYRDEGGKIQWFAQTAPEAGPPAESVKRAKAGGAVACHIHGGVTDYLFANNRLDEVRETIDMIHDCGMLAAVAGHRPEVFARAEEILDVDYYLCSYYRPSARENRPEHVPGTEERFDDNHRQAMVRTIAQLSKPVFHYKIMACGRNDPVEAFAFAAEHMRPNDAVCVGVYTKDNPKMLEDDVCLLEQSLAAAGQ